MANAAMVALEARREDLGSGSDSLATASELVEEQRKWARGVTAVENKLFGPQSVVRA
jgi:hypothetical protein